MTRFPASRTAAALAGIALGCASESVEPTSGGCQTCGEASCVSLQSDARHCGACGSACVPGSVCSNGTCTETCDPPLTDCNGACVDTTSDRDNCGFCGASCGSTGTCEASTCMCDTDTTTDPDNCGACGHRCAPGQLCTEGSCRCGRGTASFSLTVQPLFTTSCALNGCHTGANAQQDLDLSAGNAYAALIGIDAQQCSDGRKLVLAGDPSESYLMDKLLGIDLCFGNIMPKKGTVPEGALEAVSNWICGGALED